MFEAVGSVKVTFDLLLLFEVKNENSSFSRVSSYLLDKSWGFHMIAVAGEMRHSIVTKNRKKAFRSM